MSTATKSARALKSIELFREGVTLFRYDFGAGDESCTFVVTCPDGTSLWCKQTPEIDQQGQVRMLPEVVADKVLLTHADGTIEELICRDSVPASPLEAATV